jgi:SAM-dependent methyltransferase
MIRELVPWWLRIAAKLVLSRAPVGYDRWRKLNLFAHGSMHRPEYAFNVFRQHFAHFKSPPAGFVALEIGPGDSVCSALIAKAHGASAVHLIDTGKFAITDVAVYRQMAGYLQAQGLAAPRLDQARDLQDVLRACGSSYNTRGLQSLREIPAASVDFIWSHAVLEHIRRGEFADLAREMRRVLRPGGMCSHDVDLKDHLGGALNNLRIPSRWWEAEWMARSGFYTNRMRMSEILRAFASARFTAEIVATQRWQRLPTSRKSFAREFQNLEDEELCISGFQVLLR